MEWWDDYPGPRSNQMQQYKQEYRGEEAWTSPHCGRRLCPKCYVALLYKYLRERAVARVKRPVLLAAYLERLLVGLMIKIPLSDFQTTGELRDVACLYFFTWIKQQLQEDFPEEVESFCSAVTNLCTAILDLEEHERVVQTLEWFEPGEDVSPDEDVSSDEDDEERADDEGAC